ncbi:pilus assembly protein PilP [Pseudoalteromonas xiamenensis]|uniref:Pilus assembly protein PilP n=1 Tax=Pseudoalteromonas xiamenensis TaxID=882626 RepID=A0A975DEW0_9GAMM|nr:pilus assembly protein PilP [Pseudoalteromonas xiamenensis]QTH70546.1 pilus assembly protein PilP [Pseudoalteromonas xiamenensis]WMN58816.1 pilus assembly protein PilP [Pseudoalteromonas xiamenensis]
MRLFHGVALGLITLLVGCNDNTAEQKEFIDQVKASAVPKVEPIPKMPDFEHFPYGAGQLRSPFVVPEPAIIESNVLQVKNCLQPDPDRSRDPLEKYPLDNLMMKGTIAKGGVRWGLIRTSDNALYRVRKGNYIGLYHGEVVAVNADHLELRELIPDGTGCWKERLTKLELLDAVENGQSEKQ